MNSIKNTKTGKNESLEKVINENKTRGGIRQDGQLVDVNNMNRKQRREYERQQRKRSKR